MQFQGTFALFEEYGRLHTGLQRVKLKRGKIDIEGDNNLGLSSGEHKDPKSVDIDEVWKASKILDHYRRFESISGGSKVPEKTKYWLDTMQIERAKEIVKNAADASNFNVSVPEPIHIFISLGWLTHFQKTFRSLLEDGISLLIQLPEFNLPILHEET